MDIKSFESYRDHYEHDMFRKAYALLGDVGAAEDAVQTTFQRISSKFEKLNFKEPYQARSYALVATKNTALSILRQQASRAHLNLEMSEDDVVRASLCTGDTTHEAVVVQEMAVAIQDFTRTLDHRALDIFKLRQMGLKDAVIATALGLTPMNVRVIAKRARDKVDRFLEKEGFRDA